MPDSKLERFKKVTSDEKSAWLEKAKWREENEDWLEESFKVSVLILRALRAKQWSQKDLAKKMDVTPQQINKIIKGEENLSFQTVKKLERALDISILKIASRDSIFTMKISVGSKEFQFAVEGRKAEPSYAETLDANQKTSSLTIFVKSGDETTITDACQQLN